VVRCDTTSSFRRQSSSSSASSERESRVVGARPYLAVPRPSFAAPSLSTLGGTVHYSHLLHPRALPPTFPSLHASCLMMALLLLSSSERDLSFSHPDELRLLVCNLRRLSDTAGSATSVSPAERGAQEGLTRRGRGNTLAP
jgi:hypothetical protein